MIFIRISIVYTYVFLYIYIYIYIYIYPRGLSKRLREIKNERKRTRMERESPSRLERPIRAPPAGPSGFERPFRATLRLWTFSSGQFARRIGTERDRVLNSRETARLSGFERPAPARPRWVRRIQSSGRAMSKRTRAANSERHSKAERARNAISNKTCSH